MRRRDFIYKTGLLLPGLFLSGPLAMAATKTIEAALLIIHDQANPADIVNAIADQATNAQRVSAATISDVIYSKKGFTVTTHDNKRFLVQKIVIHATYQLQDNCVKLKTGKKDFHLEYTLTGDNSTVRPEYWFLKADEFHTGKVIPFIQRSRHAVLCL